MIIDGLQYANWSQAVFSEMRAGCVAAVHATIAYHEGFRETVANIIAWNRRFEAYPHLIVPGRTAADVRVAQASGCTAIISPTTISRCSRAATPRLWMRASPAWAAK